MSNFLKAITFLKSNPENRFLIITDENGNNIGLEKTTISNIPNDDLEAYLKMHLGKQDHDVMVWIEAREKIGVTDKKKGSFPVRLHNEHQPAPLIQKTQSEPTMQDFSQNSNNFLGNTIQNGANVLVPTASLMEMQRKADRLDDAKEKITELNKELQQIKHERNILDVDVRDLKIKVATAEAQKDLAVRLAKTENKSFFESQAFENMMNKAPEMLGNLVALKSGAPIVTESLGAASTLSKTKTEFLDYMSDSLTDEQVNYLGGICHFLPKEDFKKELQILITKYNSNGN